MAFRRRCGSHQFSALAEPDAEESVWIVEQAQEIVACGCQIALLDSIYHRMVTRLQRATAFVLAPLKSLTDSVCGSYSAFYAS